MKIHMDDRSQWWAWKVERESFKFQLTSFAAAAAAAAADVAAGFAVAWHLELLKIIKN